MGQFEEQIDPQQGVSLTPGPDLAPSPMELGMPPAMMQSAMPQGAPMPPPVQMPTPPQAPGQPGNLQKIISMALLGLAAGLGPRKGGGIPQGLLIGQHENDQQRQQEFHNKQVQYQQQQQEAIRLEAIQQQAMRAQAMEQAKRQATLQQALTSIRNEVKTLPDKASYDQRMDGYAGLLQGSGYRLDANWLRQAVPFVAPSGKQKAADALTAFFKNPLTQQQLKTDPNAVANGSMKIDLNDDGVPELVPVRKVMEAAGMSVLADDQGQPVSLTTGTQGDLKHVKLDNLIKTFKADNRRDPTSKEMVALVTEAEKTPKEPKEPAMMQVTETDPDTGEIVTSLVPKKAGEVSRKPARQPNQAEFQAGSYAGRMEQSGVILDQLQDDVSKMHTASFAAQSHAWPVLQSGQFQSYDQASRNFINAVLRKESGAAISQSEFDNARKQYLPQPGDTPNTLAQKKANRDYAFQTMKSAAGRGYQAPIAPPAAGATAVSADDAVIAARKKHAGR